MKSLISKLPDNPYFNFLREYWDDIVEFFKSVQKLFAKILKNKANPVEAEEEE